MTGAEHAVAGEATAELVREPRVRAPRPPVGWPAWRLRDAMARRELAVPDVVRAHLDRLAEIEPDLRASATVVCERALGEAAELQARLDTGTEPGPLCGVPITVKDVIATEGTITACGSAAFASNVPRADAVAVQRLRGAGAIVIAKTNCPEFAFGVTTQSIVNGVTRSPWGAHSPGGSSGGEAALVAAGASALGIGTDYGGSIRWPAQCCGVLALRPGTGLVDGTGQLPERGGRMDGLAGTSPGPDSVQREFQVIGPIARTVRDLGIALGVIAGPTASTGSRGFSHGADKADPFVLAGIRIGWLVNEDNGRVSSDAAAAIRGAAAALAGAGVPVEEASGALDGLHLAFNELRATDQLADLHAALGEQLHLLGSDALRTLSTAPASTADPAPLRRRLERLRERVLRQLRRTPVLLAPVAPVAACDLGGAALVDGAPMTGFALMSLCRAVSALRFPALSIPVGRDSHGLPLSAQVIAGPGHEKLVLGVGSVLERLLGGSQEPPWLAS